MKKIGLVFLLTVSIVFMSGFFPAAADQPRVALILSIGGVGDEAFNLAAYRGYLKAKEAFDMQIDLVEPGDVAEFEEHHHHYAEMGYDLIIAIGFYQEVVVEEIAPQYPDIHFALVDAEVDLPNVTSITFKEHEGSFLVGVVAGMMTDSNKVGFVGGIEMPLIQKFQIGYMEGVNYVNPEARIFVSYAGDFVDPGKGKEIAISQFEQGVDVIFHAAGGTGTGVIEASEEHCFFSIGVDSDQDHLAPGKVLTSMLKRVDIAVYEIIGDLIDGTLESGVISLGIEEEGVGTTDFQYTRDIIPDEVFNTLDEVKNKLIAGEIEIQIPDF